MTLKEYIETRGVKQTFLAKIAGVSSPVMSNIVNGHKPPPSWFIAAIRDHTDGLVDFEDFYPRKDSKSRAA